MSDPLLEVAYAIIGAEIFEAINTLADEMDAPAVDRALLDPLLYRTLGEYARGVIGLAAQWGKPRPENEIPTRNHHPRTPGSN